MPSNVTRYIVREIYIFAFTEVEKKRKLQAAYEKVLKIQTKYTN